MISSAGQLGTGTLSLTGEIPDVARAEVRLAAEPSYPRVSRFADIGRRWIRASTRVGLSPSIEFGANTAGTISIGTFSAEESKSFSEGAWCRREEVSPVRVDMLGSIESRYRDWHAGSFALNTEIQPTARDVDVLIQVQARGVDAAERVISSSSTPYVSMIWALVEAQQLRKARALLKLVPDSPEYTKLKRLLSVPVARVSQRKDFDRAPEYRWLAANAKNYVGKWVAISGDSLIAAASTLKDLREEVKKTTPARVPLLHYVE